MRGSWVAVGVALLCASGCAAHRSGSADLPGTGGSGNLRRYVDSELGFEVSRPEGDWQLDASDEFSGNGVYVPVILRHKASGAQVVIQVAPAVATPTQFAEHLTDGLREQAGFAASDPEPLPLSDNAVGFKFTIGERVIGRVAVMEGNEGQVFMMMATWPRGATEAASPGVDAIFASLRPLNRRQPTAARASAERAGPTR